MSRSTHAIFQSFLNGKSNSNYHSLRTNGTCVWSYYTPIALRYGNTFIVNTRKFSRTTSRQQGLLGSALHNAMIDNPSISVIRTEDLSFALYQLTGGSKNDEYYLLTRG